MSKDRHRNAYGLPLYYNYFGITIIITSGALLRFLREINCEFNGSRYRSGKVLQIIRAVLYSKTCVNRRYKSAQEREPSCYNMQKRLFKPLKPPFRRKRRAYCTKTKAENVLIDESQKNVSNKLKRKGICVIIYIRYRGNPEKEIRRRS